MSSFLRSSFTRSVDRLQKKWTGLGTCARFGSLPRHLCTFTLGLFMVVFLYGCKEVAYSDIEIRKGVAYIKGDSKPYSGPIKNYYKNPDGTNGKLLLEGHYSKGLKNEVWTTYSWNGEKSVVKYLDGLEEGTAFEYYPGDAVKRSRDYHKGKLHGYSIEYDSKGFAGKQLYYANGFVAKPPIKTKGGEKEGESGGSEHLSEKELEEKIYGKREKTMMEYIGEWLSFSKEHKPAASH